MNEQDYMKITNSIDERFVAEYQTSAKVHDLTGESACKRLFYG